MPDYNRQATIYWWSVVMLGAGVLAYSTLQMLALPPIAWLHIVLCAALAMLAAFLPVRTPRSTNSFTAGELFIFLLLLLHGPAAAVIASAGEAAVGSWRTSRRWTSRIASPAIAAIAMYLAGTLLSAALAFFKRQGWESDAWLLLGSIAFSVCYFLFNTWLMTTLPRLKRNERLELRVFVDAFGWLCIAYAANASVAAFLYLNMRQSGLGAVVAAIPIIGILLTTGHYFFRREEAADSVRRAHAAKQEQAERHVQELQASEQRFHSAFTHAAIGMALVSFDGRVGQTNAAFCRLLGWIEAATEAVPLAQLMGAPAQATLQAEMDRLRVGHATPRNIEMCWVHLDGSDVWVSVTCGYFVDPASSNPCFILQVQDVSARRRAEADLHHIAFHDALTGLPNRHRFNEHLVSAIARVQADPRQAFGVLFLDFDRFKLINDSMGHTAGDNFLVHVSRRIERSVDAGDVVARLGGDEFAILALEQGSEPAVLRLADRLLVTLREPLQIDGVEITSSASIGITLSTLGYQSPEAVLRDADTAMYKAKVGGKARYALFDVSLHAEVANRLRLEGDLRHALLQGQLTVQYQPLFDIRGGALTGFEALCRWVHPTLGVISPASFIPVAEESGSVVQLTDFVLLRACSQLRRWQRRHPMFAGLTMHVNVAGNDLAKSNFVDRVKRALAIAGLEANHLTIELTENILMQQLEAAMAMLDQLHEMGISLSVDDFGTGYSSLSHLSTLPIDSLKIDRSFVDRLAPGSKEGAVIRSIVLLGHSLGKSVVAEGIETLEQLDQLRELECDTAQGYFLSRPLVEDAVELFLDRLSGSSPAVKTVDIDNHLPTLQAA